MPLLRGLTPEDEKDVGGMALVAFEVEKWTTDLPGVVPGPCHKGKRWSESASAPSGPYFLPQHLWELQAQAGLQ